MKSSKITAIIMTFVLLFQAPIASSAYVLSQSDKESPLDFNDFLDDCTHEEIALMLQALKDDGDYTPQAVRKALVWRAYNKTTYLFRGDKVVDYHGIVQWAAKKSEVDSTLINTSSTYSLEHEIAKKSFAKFWESLTPEKKKEFIDEMVKKGYDVPKDGGSEFWEDMMTYAFWGFALTYPGAFLSILAAGAGIVIAAGTTASAFLLSIGPIGWAAIAAGGVYMAGADVDTVSSFIIAVHTIKTRKYIK